MRNERKKGDRQNKVTTSRLDVMDTPAWRALPTSSQALYVWIKHEWRGKKFNNNGKLRLSVRQASEAMGCAPDTAAKAFHHLQAKGFIIQTQGACLGTAGMGKAPAYELTEEPPAGETGPGKQWFLSWQKGADFPVRKGTSKAQKHAPEKTKACPNNKDATVLEFRTIA